MTFCMQMPRTILKTDHHHLKWNLEKIPYSQDLNHTFDTNWDFRKCGTQAKGFKSNNKIRMHN